MSWSETLTDTLIQNGVIPQEERPLYQYGFEQGAFQLLNWLITIPILFLFGMFWEGMVFLICYRILRVNAGGAHAKTKLRCTFYSTLLVIVCLLIIRYVPFTFFNELGILVCSGCVILAYAPVEDENKPLDFAEIYHFGKRTLVILLFEVIAWIGCCLFGCMISSCIVTAIATLAVMLIFGKINNLKIAPWNAV